MTSTRESNVTTWLRYVRHRQDACSASLARAAGLLLATVLVVVLGIAGCGREPAARPLATSSNNPIRVVATVGMVGDVVRAVGGDQIRVSVLLGPGTDPHLYKPTPEDMRQLRDAEMVFASGLKLEGKMEDVLRDLGATKPVIFITDSIPRERLFVASDHSGDSGTKQYDPHVWFDVALWSLTTTTVHEALKTQRPAQDAAFAQNARAWNESLALLHEEAKAAMSAIPRERRVLITAHDAFEYFGRAYDVEVMGIQGISTESEASLQTINRLVDVIVDRKVPAIFVESSVNPKGIEGLKQGAASRSHSVAIGGELFSDAMGEAGTPDGTYLGMVRHNIRTIAAGLK